MKNKTTGTKIRLRHCLNGKQSKHKQNLSFKL
jgi:hypothetical protein